MELKSKAEKLLKFFPIYIAKEPFGHRLYLQLIMPIVGLLYLLKNRKVDSVFMPLAGLVVIGTSLSIYYQDLESFARVIQLIGMVGFSELIRRYFEEKDYINLGRIILVATAVYLGIEFLLFGGIDKDVARGLYFDFVVKRFQGIIGESNYTAFLVSGLALFFLYKKRKWEYFASISLLLFSGSRGGVVMAFAGTILILFATTIARAYSVILTSILLTPFGLVVFEFCASDKAKLIFNKLTSGRYHIWQSHILILREHQFGIGYYRGYGVSKDYIQRGSSIVEQGFFKVEILWAQQHNFFLQMLSEFGYIGYLFFSLFVLAIFNKANSYSARLAALWLGVLVGALNLNIGAEFILYFLIAYIIFESNRECTRESNL